MTLVFTLGFVVLVAVFLPNGMKLLALFAFSIVSHYVLEDASLAIFARFGLFAVTYLLEKMLERRRKYGSDSMKINDATRGFELRLMFVWLFQLTVVFVDGFILQHN
jgi:hypothetical protein